MRLLARSALAALAGVAAGLAFEPYHWVYLLPLAVAALTLAGRHRAEAEDGFWVGLVFGTAFMLVLLPWLQVIGVYAWIAAGPGRGAVLRAGRPRRPGRGPAAAAGRCGRRLRGCWPRGCGPWCPFGGFPWGRLAFAVEDTPVAPRWPTSALRAPRSWWRCSARPWRGRVLRFRRTPRPGGRRRRARGGAGLPGLAGAVRRRGRRPDGVGGRRPGQRAGGGARGLRRAPRRPRQPRGGDLELADRIDAGTPSAPTSWSGRRTPPTSTRTPTRAPGPTSARPWTRSGRRC